jgi:hypothetical protein
MLIGHTLMNSNSPIDQDLLLLIGRLEGKLDALISQSHQQAKTIMELEARISKLEAYKGWLIGAASAASLIASWVFTKIL